MNISDWPLGQIMDLPDHCFGRRFLIGCCCRGGGQSESWDIAEVPFPEVSVIWNLYIQSSVKMNVDNGIRIALGDQLPTSALQMDRLEPVFYGLGVQGPGPRHILVEGYGNLIDVPLRMPIRTAGRWLCCELGVGPATTEWVNCILTVSSIPREIPDCLISV